MADVHQDTRPASLVVSPAPHVTGSASSARLSWSVAFCLLPAAAWGVFLFGVPALGVLGVAVAASLAAELLASLAARRVTIGDGSAIVTGLLVGMLMPPGVPLYVPAAASGFGIIVAKQSFGGLGRNWMNPALAGVVVALLSWSDGMSRWLPVRSAAPTVTAVPPLEALRNALTAGAPRGGALEMLRASGYPWSGMDSSVVGWVNTHVLSLFGWHLPGGCFDLLVGNISGTIGGTSVPLLLLGAALLLSRRVIRWQLPVTYLAIFCLAAQVFGGLPAGGGWFVGNMLFQVFSGGGLVLGAFFMATDPVTSPLTRTGQLAYGLCLGVLTFFLRTFGSLGDGVPLAILLGNCLSPLIDRFTRPAFPTQRKAAPG